jgi:archaellum component FlaC
MSDDKVSLEWLGSRVLTMTAGVRDMQLLVSALEHRFSALEGRFTAMEVRLGGVENRLSSIDSRIDGIEQRMSALLSLLVRVAERIGVERPAT